MMATEIRIPVTAVVATLRSLLLVGQLRTLLDVTEVFGELLDDARKSLDRANSIRSSIRKTSPSVADDARKRAHLEATRACSGWAHSFRDAERRIGESFRGMEALLADIGDAGCRATVAHLARVQPPAVKFPGYSPIAWEAETARNLAYRCLFRIRQFLDADTSEPGPDDPEALEGAINLRDGLRCDLTAILHSRHDLDRLETAISADLAELNAAADAVEFSAPKSDIEPRRFAELIREAETLRAGFMYAAAVYPAGGVHCETDDGVSVGLFGMSDAGKDHLQNSCRNLEPVLKSLGASIGERGETADGRLLRWAVEMVDRSGGEQEHSNPFSMIEIAICRFVGRLLQPAWSESNTANGVPETNGKTTRPKVKRQRGRYRPRSGSKPLTAIQTETMLVFGQCEGDLAEVARRLGKNRKTVKQAVDAACRKMGVDVASVSHKTVQSLRDRRGSISVSHSDDRRLSREEDD